MKYLPLRVNIALFLFSKGDRISEHVGTTIEESTVFFKDQYDKGRELLEEIIEEFSESVFAADSDLDQFVTERIASLMIDNIDFANRCGDMSGGADVVHELVKLAKTDPQALRDMIDFHGDQFRGTNQNATSGHVTSLPDDFQPEGDIVPADAVADHVPTGEDRTRYDELTHAGEGEIVAVLDTGVDTDHPDLEGKILGVFSEVPGESGEDINGHGTHVFGTCCGPKEISLSHRAKGISIKVLGGRNGSGQSAWIEKGLLRALAWRGPNGERVTHINMSIGGGGFHAGTERAMGLCVAAGIIIFAASGNDGWRRNVDLVNHPARSVHAIAVGALTRDEDRAAFTSPGPLVDEASQGVAVLSSNLGGGRVRLSGTSMATPLSCSKSMSNQSFHVAAGYSRLEDTVDHRAFVSIVGRDVLEPGEDDTSGSGVFDVYETLLSRTDDDVTMLATGRRSKAAEILAACFMAVLFLFTSSAQAQEEQNIIEEVKVVQTTTRKVGSLVLSEKEVTLSETSVTLPAKIINVIDDKVLLVGPNLEPYEEATPQGVLTLEEPGEYLILREGTDYQRVTVEEPEPEFDLSTIEKLSREMSTKLNDAPTASILSSAYGGMLYVFSDPNVKFEEAEAMLDDVITEAMQRRPWESQRIDWTNGFRRPMQAEFERIGVADVATLRAAIQEVIKGLAPGPNAASTPIGFDRHDVIICPGSGGFCPSPR